MASIMEHVLVIQELSSRVLEWVFLVHYLNVSLEAHISNLLDLLLGVKMHTNILIISHKSQAIILLRQWNKGRDNKMGSWENSVEVITGHCPVTDTLTLTLTLIYLSKQTLFQSLSIYPSDQTLHFLPNLTTF